jgi:hypothetical protein
MSETLHLIGIAPMREPNQWNRPLVVLHTGGGAGIRLTFASGMAPHDNGGTFPVTELRHRSISEDSLRSTNSEWLKPFVERWERGESVDPNEILTRFAEIHGHPPEQATRFAEFPSILREREWAKANPPLEYCLQQLLEACKGLFVPGLDEEAVHEAKLIRAYIEEYYVQKRPAMAILPRVPARHQEPLKWILSASAAARRDGPHSPEERLAALRSPHIKAWTKESFDYLFPG